MAARTLTSRIDPTVRPHDGEVIEDFWPLHLRAPLVTLASYFSTRALRRSHPWYNEGRSVRVCGIDASPI